MALRRGPSQFGPSPQNLRAGQKTPTGIGQNPFPQPPGVPGQSSDQPNPVDQLFGPAQGIPSEAVLELGEKEAKMIPRDAPDPTLQRKALVNAWTSSVKEARKYWKPSFDRMREDSDFAYGRQWSRDDKDKRYTANITLREIAQRTAFLYARNPKAVARRREMMLNTVWDGTQAQLQSLMQAAGQAVQSASQGGMPGMGGPPGAPPGGAPGAPPGVTQAGGPLPNGAAAPGGSPGMPPFNIPGAMAGPTQAIIQQGMAIAQDAAQVNVEEKLLDKIANTL